MNNYCIGDLVWIPDGTINNTGMAIEGPTCGLVTSVVDATGFKWLRIKIGSDNYMVREKTVRKIES